MKRRTSALAIAAVCVSFVSADAAWANDLGGIAGTGLSGDMAGAQGVSGGHGRAESSLSAPSLSSRPSATAKLFLDFDGVYYNGNWAGKTPGGDGYVEAYDIDGDPTTFTAAELNRIDRIWQRVAEAYSPFDIDVTTIDPGSYARREVARVVIGGDNKWYGSGGGVAYVGGFTWADDSAGHTSWVFPKNMGNGNVHNTASATIHEAGHQFGLSHQRRYDDDGNALDNGYDRGDKLTAPHMGVTYYSNRGLWSDGTIGWNDGPVRQFDLRRLASTSGNRAGGGYWNGFGFREDDYGDAFATAMDLGTVTEAGFTLSGVIEQNTDRDLMRFTIEADAEVTLDVINAPEFGMLDAMLLVWDDMGTLLADVDPAEDLSAVGAGLHSNWESLLEAGSYFVGIGSHGGYGDVGQWYLTGSVTLIPEPSLAAFAGLAGLLLRRRH